MVDCTPASMAGTRTAGTAAVLTATLGLAAVFDAKGSLASHVWP